MEPRTSSSADAGAGKAGGDRAQLSRTLKPGWVWAIALGSAVGWGAFVLPTDWLATAGPLGAILGFLIGGALMLVIAVSYGFLIKSFPVCGGEFAYALNGFGRKHAFLCAWFLTLGYMCIVALNASALALLSRFVLPQVAEQGRLFEVAGWDVYLGEVLIASAAIVIFALLNIRGASLSGRLQFVFVMIMIAGVALLGLGVLLHSESQWSNVSPAFALDVPPWTAVLAIVAIAPWAYVGFDNVPQAAEEYDFSPAKAFRLIVFAIVVAALIYSVMILATASAMPWTELTAGDPRWGTGDAIAGLFGGAGVMLLALSLSMGICTGLNGFTVAASRLLFAMGRARMIPQGFAQLHPRYRTPYVGLAFTAALCLVAPWFGREALLWVVDMSAVGVTIAYTYTCLAAFKRFRGVDESGEPAGSVAKQGLSLAGAVIGLTFLALLVIPGSPAAFGPESAVSLLIWIVLGLLFYIARIRENSALSDQELDYLVFGDGGSGQAAQRCSEELEHSRA
ncbi:APC family permease [Haloechinothrix sp. YIM 98757]|uniref:APC family permease n=1 Tax=Haloechinothrix aidingensis TaxID=2752311 RepID=A0A838AET5_9PSEU|nr:APC family permease [Haloechinothrix aidingensis]MBA0127819.1 APC family permease [Haloechinothrix aidingensis]